MYPNIEAERARKHLSAEQLATELGVTRKTYYNWCKRGKIPQNKLILMSEIFGVSADYLLRRDGEPEKQTVEDVGSYTNGKTASAGMNHTTADAVPLPLTREALGEELTDTRNERSL